MYLSVSLALLYTFRTGLNYVLVSENIWPEAEKAQAAFTFNHIVAVVLGEVYVIALVSSIKLAVDWVNEKGKNDKLKKEQLQTELNFLKSQIQPHFFFNTLNNLYSLALSKSDKTPDMVLKLSDIMQYVLYDVKDPKISLLKEINYIYSYLELEKLRHGSKIDSNTEIIGDLNGVEVPPLLFLTFIENCFKHGTKNNDNIKLNISFEKLNEYVIFKVENNFSILNKIVTKHGIGIKNTKRRLHLLYENDFTLSTNVIKDSYLVNLKIPI